MNRIKIMTAMIQMLFKLKIGAQVMMIKNDLGKRWVNGTIGIIERLYDNYIVVKIGTSIYRVEREKWEEIEYRNNNNTQKIEERPKGAFIQYPVKLEEIRFLNQTIVQIWEMKAKVKESNQ